VFRPVQLFTDREGAQVEGFSPREIALRQVEHSEFVEREGDAEMAFAESLLALGERAIHQLYGGVDLPFGVRLVGLLHQFQHHAESFRLFRRHRRLVALRA
jgi:hypothetical protein